MSEESRDSMYFKPGEQITQTEIKDVKPALDILDIQERGHDYIIDLDTKISKLKKEILGEDVVKHLEDYHAKLVYRIMRYSPITEFEDRDSQQAVDELTSLQVDRQLQKDTEQMLEDEGVEFDDASYEHGYFSTDKDEDKPNLLKRLQLKTKARDRKKHRLKMAEDISGNPNDLEFQTAVGEMRALKDEVDMAELIQSVLDDSTQERKRPSGQVIKARQCLLSFKKYISKPGDSNLSKDWIIKYADFYESLDIKSKVRVLREEMEQVKIDMEAKMAEASQRLTSILALGKREVEQGNGEIEGIVNSLQEQYDLIGAEYEDKSLDLDRIYNLLDVEKLDRLSDDERIVQEEAIDGITLELSQADIRQTYLSHFTDLLSQFDLKLQELRTHLFALKKPSTPVDRQLSQSTEIGRFDSTEAVNFAEAREIMGEKYFHDEKAVAKTFSMPADYIPEAPPIPFSRQELEKAKEDGCMLIYRVSKTKDGKPLTMNNMHKMSKNKVGKLLFSGDKKDAWYNKPDSPETFPDNETCRDGWALVQVEPLKGSTSINYLEQSYHIAEEIDRIYENHDNIPKPLQDAIKELDEQSKDLERDIEKLENGSLSKDEKIDLANRLASLKINQLMRRNTTEALFDMAVHFADSDERTLESVIYDWSITVSSDGPLVDPGRFDSDGASVCNGWPCIRLPNLAVVVSRSVGNLSLAA